MRRTILTILAILTALTLSHDVFGQAQIYTRKERLKDFTSKTTKVVMTGDELLDEALKESVAATWTVSPYEFCTNDDFQKLKTSDSYYFLLVVKGQSRKESEPGIDFLTLVKGGVAADKTVNDMFEVLTFPLRSAKEPSGREFVFLPALLGIIQDHASGLTDSEMKAYSSVGATQTKKLKIKRIYFSKEDFAPQVDRKTISSFDEDTLVSDDEEVDEIFSNGTYNTVVSYMVAPTEPVSGSVCYKMLIGSDDHNLYWYRKHKISSRQGKGFLDGDLKAIKHLR